MCFSLLEVSTKLKVELYGQITSATVAIQMCLSGRNQNKFLSKSV